MTRPVAIFMLLTAALLWGSGNVANKTVLDHVGPLTAVAWRCFLAALVMVPFWSIDGPGIVGRAWLRGAVGVALLFASALSMQQMAFQSTTVTNASFLINTASVITPVVAWLLLGELPRLRVAVAGLVTLIGVFLMSGMARTATELNAGDVACLVSALLYAGWMVALGRHAMIHGRPIRTSLVQFVVTAALLAPMSLAFEAPTLAGAVRAWPELAFLGVFSTAGAFALTTCAQRHISASVAAVLVSAESVFGAAGAYLLLNERTAIGGVVGAALILAAIGLVALGPTSAATAARRSAARL